MFDIAYRDTVQARLVERVRQDGRISSCVLIGSLSRGGGDAWSDIDFTFEVGAGHEISKLLGDYGGFVADAFGGFRLYDVARGSRTYRVFLLPGCLQVDLSFAPHGECYIYGDRYEVVFGVPALVPERPLPNPESLFGECVHHLIRANVAIERERLCEAGFWLVDAARLALEIHCIRSGWGIRPRNFDGLPADIRERYVGSRAIARDRDSVIRSMKGLVVATLADCRAWSALAQQVSPILLNLSCFRPS